MTHWQRRPAAGPPRWRRDCTDSQSDSEWPGGPVSASGARAVTASGSLSPGPLFTRSGARPGRNSESLSALRLPPRPRVAAVLGRFGVLAGDCEWFVRDIRRGLRC